MARKERRRRQRNQRSIARAEEVLRVEGGVVRAAPGGDDETPRAQIPVPGADGVARGPALLDQAGGDLRLLADLVVESAHFRNRTFPPTIVRRTRRSPSRTTRSAHPPTWIRPNPRSPSTRAGTVDAIAIARDAFTPGTAAMRRTRSSMLAALPASVPYSSRTTMPSLTTGRPVRL